MIKYIRKIETRKQVPWAFKYVAATNMLSEKVNGKHTRILFPCDTYEDIQTVFNNCFYDPHLLRVKLVNDRSMLPSKQGFEKVPHIIWDKVWAPEYYEENHMSEQLKKHKARLKQVRERIHEV